MKEDSFNNYFIFLMRDGHCAISLLSSRKNRDVTLYKLQLLHEGQAYTLELRYSCLRIISKLLPQASVKFPPPSHLVSLISSLTSSAAFPQERQQQMTRFFESVSTLPDLQKTQGFSMLLAIAQEQQFGQQERVPNAPQLRGKQLKARELIDQMIVS